MESRTYPKCDGITIKNGLIKGHQRLRCRYCHFNDLNTNEAWRLETGAKIVALLKEGCGILSIARFLRILPTAVQLRILMIASTIKKPNLSFGKEYEVDELCTYFLYGSKKHLVAYALRRDDKQNVDLELEA
jgi:insertion element IS1 protein InsB